MNIDLRRISRDTVLFVAGLLGLGHETVIHKPDERPTLLAVFAAMVGLPAMLRADEKRKRQEGGDQ